MNDPNFNNMLDIYLNGAIAALETAKLSPNFMKGIYDGYRELSSQIAYYVGVYPNKKDRWHEIYNFCFDNYNLYIPGESKYTEGYKVFYKITLRFFAKYNYTFYI